MTGLKDALSGPVMENATAYDPTIPWRMNDPAPDEVLLMSKEVGMAMTLDCEVPSALVITGVTVMLVFGNTLTEYLIDGEKPFVSRIVCGRLTVNTERAVVGFEDGLADGFLLVGRDDGTFDGIKEGMAVGPAEGDGDGLVDGSALEG